MGKPGILQTLARVWVLSDGTAVLNLFESVASVEILRLDSFCRKMHVYTQFFGFFGFVSAFTVSCASCQPKAGQTACLWTRCRRKGW